MTLCFYFIIAAGIILRILNLSDFSFNLYMDRDIHRIINWDWKYLALGPELTEGSNTPGGGYYVIVKVLYYISFEKISVFYFNVFLLQVFGSCVIFFSLKKFFNQEIALLVLASMMSMTVLFLHFQVLWNPSIGSIFSSFAFYYFLEYFLGKKENALIKLIFFVCLASQCHLSFAIYLIIIPILYIFFKPPLRLSSFLRAMSIFLVLYSPYFVYEATKEHYNIEKLDMGDKKIDYHELVYKLESTLNLYQYFSGELKPSHLPGYAWTSRPGLLTEVEKNKTSSIVVKKASHISAIVYILMIPVALLFTLFKQRFRNHNEFKLVLSSLFIGAFVNFFIFLINSENLIQARKYIFLVPFLYTSVAIGFYELKEKFKGKVFVKFLINVFVIIPMFFNLIDSSIGAKSFSSNFRNYSVIKAELAPLTNAIHRVSFEGRGVDLAGDEYELLGNSDLLGGKSFFLKSDLNNYGHKTCFLFSENKKILNMNSQEQLEYLSKYHIRNIIKLESTLHLVKIEYTPWMGNCLSGSLQNHYVKNNLDKILLREKYHLKEYKQTYRVERNKYIFKLRRELEALGKRDVFFLVEFKRKGPQIFISLYSSLLAFDIDEAQEVTHDYLIHNAKVVLYSQDGVRRPLKMVHSYFKKYTSNHIIPPLFYNIEDKNFVKASIEFLVEDKVPVTIPIE